jgi:hypothetical protein
MSEGHSVVGAATGTLPELSTHALVEIIRTECRLRLSRLPREAPMLAEEATLLRIWKAIEGDER